MATGELNQQPQDQFSHADPKPETGNPGPTPRLPIWSSLRTRLLVSLLGLVIIAVLAVGYMGVNSVQSMGESAQQVSGKALRGQPIGALGFKEADANRQWSADDVTMAETIAEQLALA
ncbi:MAG: hypothetical protein V3S14_01500, partial [Anaerolineae bacterium]